MIDYHYYYCNLSGPLGRPVGLHCIDRAIQNKEWINKHIRSKQFIRADWKKVLGSPNSDWKYYIQSKIYNIRSLIYNSFNH